MDNFLTIEFYRDLDSTIVEQSSISLELKVGTTGAPGEGAYELAVAAGYRGTKESFVSALSEIGAIEDLLSQI